jgi:hypothetical protein
MAAINTAVCGLGGDHEFGSDFIFIVDILPAKAVAVFLLHGGGNKNGNVVGDEI